jgi:hypothetical protein
MQTDIIPANVPLVHLLCKVHEHLAVPGSGLVSPGEAMTGIVVHLRLQHWCWWAGQRWRRRCSGLHHYIHNGWHVRPLQRCRIAKKGCRRGNTEFAGRAKAQATTHANALFRAGLSDSP